MKLIVASARPSDWPEDSIQDIGIFETRELAEQGARTWIEESEEPHPGITCECTWEPVFKELELNEIQGRYGV